MSPARAAPALVAAGLITWRGGGRPWRRRGWLRWPGLFGEWALAERSALIAPLPPRAQRRDVYPIVPYFGYAERIVAATGFSLMAETEALRERHGLRPVSAPAR
jgi:hypothetical protein